MSGEQFPVRGKGEADLPITGINPSALPPDAAVRIGKRCVFCGQRPVVKTREHVLPQWLIELTGDPKREVDFQVWTWKGPEVRTFAFDQFTAPACDECNNEWSDLEGSCKSLIQGLAEGRSVLTGEQAQTLLDWMDKVRIGVWLAGLALSNNPLGIPPPRFHIATRVAAKDRLLYIARTREPSTRLSVSDFMNPIFQTLPAYLWIYVNGLAFVNASSIGIAGGPLALPYIRGRKSISGDRISGEIVEGRMNWCAAPAQFGILAQACWGMDVLSDDQRKRHRDRLADDGSRSLVHIHIAGNTQTLNWTQAAPVFPVIDTGRDELLQLANKLMAKLRRCVYRLNPAPQGKWGREVWAAHKEMMRKEERALL